jgi:imidazole glycerol-phosphate synthase subunit HisF
MLRPRIIPCLLIHNGGLAKTRRFKEPKYVGDPINAVKIFNEKEADELMVLDIDATVSSASPNLRLIAQFAAECRMPLCYGGGIKTTEQAKQIIGLGAEKVALSAAALERPALITEIADAIGSQSIVVVLDAKKRLMGGHDVWTHNGRRNTGKDVIEAARQAAERGAGEVVVNSIDHDGMMDGYDLDLAQKVRQAVRLPLTVLGGAGKLDDIGRLIDAVGVVGASAGSFFVFKGPYRAVLITYPSPAEKEDLIRVHLAHSRKS